MLTYFNDFTVLNRIYTCEELLAPGAPFIKRVLTVSYCDGLTWAIQELSFISRILQH